MRDKLSYNIHDYLDDINSVLEALNNSYSKVDALNWFITNISHEYERACKLYNVQSTNPNTNMIARDIAQVHEESARVLDEFRTSLKFASLEKDNPFYMPYTFPYTLEKVRSFYK